MGASIGGTYDIQAATPVGTVRGTALISQAGTCVRGRIDMGPLGRDDMEGTCDERGSFHASGERRQFPFGLVRYEIAGAVDADGHLRAKLTSRVADIEISGTRRG